MAEKYFDKFPIINYANNLVVDITRRTTLLDRVSNNPYVFYPYDISDAERPDQLSARYYEDSYQSWIIYLANKIVDPYYEWYMQDSEFVQFIEKKYGSYEIAITKIRNYKNNWEFQSNIDVSTFNALNPGMKKYWEAEYGYNNIPISYKRKSVDWYCTTNKIVRYSISSPTEFEFDEICEIVFSPTKTGQGQVVSFSDTEVCLQHVSGNYVTSDEVSISETSYIRGTESDTNVLFTDVSVVATNIPSDEENYWIAQTYYDYEYAKNEYNKSIRVLDAGLKQTISDNLKTLLEE